MISLIRFSKSSLGFDFRFRLGFSFGILGFRFCLSLILDLCLVWVRF